MTNPDAGVDPGPQRTSRRQRHDRGGLGDEYRQLEPPVERSAPDPPAHERDWLTLTRDLAAEFTNLPVETILTEVNAARRATERLGLPGAERQRIAELAARNRLSNVAVAS